jgi:hypothetical protein
MGTIGALVTDGWRAPRRNCRHQRLSLRDAKQLGAVSYRDVTFICELVNHRRPEHLAAKKEVTPRTIRNHRDAIEHRLRIAVLTAA